MCDSVGFIRRCHWTLFICM